MKSLVYVHCNYGMEFDWDAENKKHIGLHVVQTVEAEEALQNDPVVVQYQERDGEDRVLVLGQTNAGRLLAVVYTERGEKIRVVTAYPMNKRLEAIYFQER
jgi:uncharacterized DUF497 family protein